MKEWPNLETGIVGLQVNAVGYREWHNRECGRLKSDWARDTSRINPDFLQPMAFFLHVVALEIKKSSTRRLPEGGQGYFVADYVVARDGKLRVGFSHTKLSEMPGAEGAMQIGMPVLAAGQITYGDGVIQRIDNASGHYKPSCQDRGLIHTAFSSAGLAQLMARGATVPALYTEL